MKKNKRTIIVIILSLALVTRVNLGITTNVYAATKSKAAYYSCKVHNNCMYAKLSAKFNKTKCTDVYWEGSKTHWPNGITLKDTKKYAKSARGTYTIYASIVTQWASLSFKSETDTIYIYK
ncbi:hypothetical protein [uncultured Eubacterium sp.]|uniref:hypothetical protein n=1 Tax=uncultured Eubacterium sp. TaxID=165185 RepID=UPI002671CFA1|nr:hypothetical protein [uncultured Eubacterium sp.]